MNNIKIALIYFLSNATSFGFASYYGTNEAYAICSMISFINLVALFFLID